MAGRVPRYGLSSAFTQNVVLMQQHTHELKRDKLIFPGNVAYNKPASQSSSPYTQWSERFPADRAVDGNTHPRMENGHCALPDVEWGQHAWWRVDLEDTFNIYYVIIHNRDQSEYMYCYACSLAIFINYPDISNLYAL